MRRGRADSAIPAHVFYVVDAMIEAGVTLGLRREAAHRLAVRTVVGAGVLRQETGEHPVVLREHVLVSPVASGVHRRYIRCLHVDDRRD